MFQKKRRLKSLAQVSKNRTATRCDDLSIWIASSEGERVWRKSRVDKSARLEAPSRKMVVGGNSPFGAGNCIDRHLKRVARNGTKDAILGEGDGRDKKRTLTYQQLHARSVFRQCAKRNKIGGKAIAFSLSSPRSPEAAIALAGSAQYRCGAVVVLRWIQAERFGIARAAGRSR